MGDRPKVSFRVLLVTQDDPFYVPLFFQEFLARWKCAEDICGVVITDALGKRGLLELGKQMYAFYGPIDFVKVGVRYIAKRVQAVYEKLIGIDGFHTVDQICRSYGIRVIREDNVHEKRFLEELRSMKLDLIISVASSVIFRKELIQIPKHGCVNIHSGRLPRYRGMMPNFWQMYHREERVGISIHEMNTRIDDGRIILQKDLPIDPNETLDSLMRRTKKISGAIMVEAIEMIKAGKVTYMKNAAEQGSYFSFPTKEDVRNFRRKGMRII